MVVLLLLILFFGALCIPAYLLINRTGLYGYLMLLGLGVLLVERLR